MASTLFNNKSSAQTRSLLSLDSDLKQPVVVIKGGRLESARIMWNFFFNKPMDTRPAGEIPVQALTKKQLLAAPNNTLYRIGHSTVLMKLNDTFWLTDPMFSERAVPIQFAGPERFHQAPININELTTDQGGGHLPRTLRPLGLRVHHEAGGEDGLFPGAARGW